MPCGWGVKAGMVRVYRWQVKLCGPYLSALEIRSLYIKRYINSPSLLLYFLLYPFSLKYVHYLVGMITVWSSMFGDVHRSG